MENHPEVFQPLNVLVIDDEESIRSVLNDMLVARGHVVYSASTAEEGLALAEKTRPDLVILDLMLPGMDGLEACRRLRTWYEGPVLILSVRDSDADKITTLDAGADDYLTKPFSSSELLARIRALMRRTSGIDITLPAETIAGDLRIDFDSRQVSIAGEVVDVTPTEYEVLAQLARARGRVVTFARLIEGVWGTEDGADVKLLRVHVSNLRRKIEPKNAPPRYVVTEPGVGFRLAGAE